MSPARVSAVGLDLLTWLGLPSSAGALFSPCPGSGDARRPCPTLAFPGGPGVFPVGSGTLPGQADDSAGPSPGAEGWAGAEPADSCRSDAVLRA